MEKHESSTSKVARTVYISIAVTFLIAATLMIVFDFLGAGTSFNKFGSYTGKINGFALIFFGVILFLMGKFTSKK